MSDEQCDVETVLTSADIANKTFARKQDCAISSKIQKPRH